MEVTSFVPLQSPNVSSSPVVQRVCPLLTPSHPARGQNDLVHQASSSGGGESEGLSLAAPVVSSPNSKGQPEFASNKAYREENGQVGAERPTSLSLAPPLPRKSCDSLSQQVSRFTSKKVRLPRTVEDLIASYEALYERHEAQKVLLDAFYKEVGRLALRPAQAAAGKGVGEREVAVVEGEGASFAGLASATKRTPSAEHAPAGQGEGREGAVVGGVVCGKVVPSKVVPTSGVKGSVVGAVVVQPRDLPKPLEAVSERLVSSQSGTGRLDAAEATPEEAEKGCMVLQAKALAMEAAEQLLATTREEVRELVQERDRLEIDLTEAREEVRRVQEENKALCAAFQADHCDTDGLARVGAEEARQLMTLLHTSASLTQDLKDELKLGKETIVSLEYRESQLKTHLETLQMQNNFLNEKIVQIEGQLHRLLSGDAMHAMNTNSLSASVRSNQGGAHRSIAGGGGRGGGQATPNAPPQLTPLERYNVETLQKQVNELRTIVDRLHQSNTKHEATRAKLEGQLRTLTKENATLKQSLLEYRRKVGNMELNLESEVSLRNYEERCRGAEKEAVRLRQALSEHKEKYASQMREVEQRLDHLRLRDTLYEKSTKHLLSRCVSSTIELLTCKELYEQRRRAPLLGACIAEGLPQATETFPANEEKEEEGGGKRETTPAGPERSGVEGQDSPPPVPVPETVVGPSSSAAEPRGEGKLPTEAAPMGSRAEIRRLEQLNRELRQALARSQEESQTKSRLLARAQFTVSTTSLGTNAPYQALSLRRDPAAVTEPSSTGESLEASASEAPRRVSSAGLLSSPTRDFERLSLAGASRLLNEIEQRYDPEHLDPYEAVQLENSALLLRLSILQQEKWTAASQIEALRSNCAVLRAELQQAMCARSGPSEKDTTVGQLRSLQNLLQETLSEKLKLEERIKVLESQTPYGALDDH